MPHPLLQLRRVAQGGVEEIDETFKGGPLSP